MRREKNNDKSTDNPGFSEKLAHKIADIVPSILYIMEIDTFNTVFVNENPSKSIGYTSEEVIGMGEKFVLEKIHPDDQQPFLHHIEKLKKAKQGEVLLFEYQLLTAYGEWRWFQSRDTVYEVNADGSVSHIIGIANDITDRKEMDQRLMKNQEQLTEAQAIARLGYYTFHIPSGKITISSMLAQMAGVPENSDLNYSQWVQVVHPDYRQIFMDKYEKILSQGMPSYQMEYKVICQNTGEEKWVRGSGKVRYNEKHEAVELFGTILDITPHMNIREQLARSNEKLDNIIRHSSSVFYSHRPDGLITYQSPQARELLDCESETEILHWQQFVTENPHNRLGVRLTAEAFRTGKKQPQYELEMKTAKGRIIWVRVDESPVIENGEPVAMVGSLTDITEHKHLEVELKRSNELYKAINVDLSDSIKSVNMINLELVKARAELSVQKELLRKIIENLPVGLQVFDNKGVKLMMNKRQMEIFGLSSLSEGVGRFNILTDPLSKANGASERFKEVFDGHSIRNELSINLGLSENNWNTRKDELIIDEIIFPVFNADNEVSHAIALIEDITDKKRNEEEIRKSAERLRQLIESSPVAIVLYTPQGRVLSINKRFTGLFGYEKEEIPTKDIWDMKVYPDKEYRERVRHEWTIHVEEYFAGKPFRSFEREVKCKDGSIKTIEFGFGAIEDMYITTFVDITERKTILKEIERRKELLNQNEKISKTGAWEYDIEKKEVFWTDGLYRLFEEDDLNRKIEISESIRCYDPDDRIKILQAVEGCITTDRKYDMVNHLTTFKGNEKWIRTILSQSVIPEGKPGTIIGSLMDITEQVNDETKLKELNATKDKIFSIVSHDLRNPMGAIISIAELALENINEINTDDLIQYLEIINKSGQQSFNLLNNLLEWSSLNTGRIIIEPASFRLYPSIESIEELFKSLIHRKGIAFNNMVPDSFIVFADEKTLNTVLRNLISNAIKFTSENGSISIMAERTESDNIISVSDTGVGIDEADMSKLFDSGTFFTKNGTNHEKGSGLGLILCKEFIKMHGGRLSVNSAPGKGTTFSVFLPVQD